MDAGGYDEILPSREDKTQCSEANVEIKIKMMDAQTYTLHVDKYMPVPALKEQIASVTGVLSEHQRLICRGKVLKDDQLLSAYHVEDGHTLHLVVKQPITSAANGADDSATAPAEGNENHSRPRVVVGAFNLSDQGDGNPPDFSRVVSAVLGSFGIANVGSVVEGADLRGNLRARGLSTDSVRQPQVSWGEFERLVNGVPFTSESPDNLVQVVIPDSLTTLSQYLCHLRREFNSTGVHPIISEVSGPHVEDGHEPPPAASTSLHGGLPTPSSLASVLLSARLLLVEEANECLSQLATQLEEQENLTEPSARAQIQSDALRSGNLFQKLGALLYELGRTTMMLRMGHAPSDAVVNAGPALFISNSTPSPIMVQPVPFHAGVTFSHGPHGSVRGHDRSSIIGGSGFLPRNLDIRIRSVNREGESTDPWPSQGQNNVISDNNSTRREAEIRVMPVRTVVAAVPASVENEHNSWNSMSGLIYPVVADIHHDSGPQTYLEALMNNRPFSGREIDPNEVGNRDSVDAQDAGTAPAVTDQGIFLSNILCQIMPIISQSIGGSLSNTPSSTADWDNGMTHDPMELIGSSSQRERSEFSSPKSKRQKKE